MNNIVVHNQFTTSKNDLFACSGDGKSIQEFLESIGVPKELLPATRVYVGDIFVEQDMYKYVRPKPMAKVKVIILPQGDDNQTLAMIAMVAIAIYAGPAGAQLSSTYFGGSAWGAAAITAGITIAGALVVHALFPPPTIESYNYEEGSQALTIAGSRNSFRYDKVVPRVYGTVKFFPPHAAQPYTSSLAGNQYLYMVFDLGYGPITATDLKIGETSIDDYEEVEYVIHETVNSSDDLQYFTSDIDSEAVNTEIEDTDTITRTTSSNFKYAQIDLTFGAGLYSITAEGGHTPEEVFFEVTVYDELDNLIPDASVTVDVYAYQIAVGVIKTSTTDFSLNSTLDDGFTVTAEIRVDAIDPLPDNIKIDLNRTSSTEAGVQHVNTCIYGTIRTFKTLTSIEYFRLIDYTPPDLTYASHSMVEMRIRATDQLNGVIDNFNCIASAKLRKYNGVDFDAPAVTDNPAWIYADVLTGTMNQRPKADDRLNWGELKRWADFCDTLAAGENGIDTKAHTCNFVLDYSITIHKLLSDVASVGRASPDVYDDMYSVIFDEEKTTKVQLFSNMNTTDFNSSRVYTEIPDAVRISFRDPDSDWQVREHVVYNDGFDIYNAKVFEDIKAPMLTSSNEAYRNGRYWLKQAALRKETITFKTDLEWLECKRGDFVGLQMDTMLAGGTPARVKTVSGQEVTLDNLPNANGNTVDYFELRKTDGTIVSGPVAYYSVLDEYVLDLGINGATVGDLIIINSSGQEAYELLIKNIDVASDQTAIITCVEYVDALYDLASEPVPIYDPSINTVLNQNEVPAKLANLEIVETITLVNKKPYITLTLNYYPETGKIPSFYKIFKKNLVTDEWIFQGNTSESSYVWGESILAIDNPIIGNKQCFSVVGVSENGAFLNPAFGIQECIYPIGDDTIPPSPDYFVVEDTAENFRRFWWGFNNVEKPEDFAGVEMRYTRGIDNWSSATALHNGLLVEPPFEIRALPEGLQNVLMKSVDTSGNYSVDEAKITFNLGDRVVENVLDTHPLSYPWTGLTVSGSVVIDASNDLSADPSTTGLMWGTVDTTLMWGTPTDLMWTGSYTGFAYVNDITTLADGITNLHWVGTGEIKLSYFEGHYADAFSGHNITKDLTTTLNSHNYDLSDVTWTKTSLVTVAKSGSMSPALTDDVYLIEDNSTGIAGNLYESATISAATDHTASVYIKKDNNTSRYAFFDMSLASGGTTTTRAILINTRTGASLSMSNSGLTSTYGVEDKGNFWQVWITALNDTNVVMDSTLYPSYKDTWVTGGPNTTLQDSVEAWDYAFVEGDVPHDGIITAQAPINTAPYDFEDPAWTLMFSLTVTANSTIRSPIDTDTYTIDNAGNISWSIKEPNLPITAGNTYTASVYIAKDSETGRSPQFSVYCHTGTVQLLYFKINTSTGAPTLVSYSGIPLTGFGVIDKGSFWQAWITFEVISATGVSMNYNPSDSTTAGLRDSVAWCMALVEGQTPYDGLAFASASPVYVGDGQGVIPYTSPVFLPASDYGIIVECPVTVEVSSIESLDWIVDVPDINQYFEDVEIAATGTTTITLTKPFIEVTNVSIVLQEDGSNARYCVIQSKSATEVGIICYNGGNSQQDATIDVRVQGY